MSTDSGDRARATIAETEIKRSLTEGVVGFTIAVMTPEQYTPAAVPTLARDANRSTAAGVICALRSMPLRLPGYLLTDLPNPAEHQGALVYCSNGAAGSPVVAFSDGADWRRVDTLAVVS